MEGRVVAGDERLHDEALGIVPVGGENGSELVYPVDDVNLPAGLGVPARRSDRRFEHAGELDLHRRLLELVVVGHQHRGRDREADLLGVPYERRLGHQLTDDLIRWQVEPETFGQIVPAARHQRHALVLAGDQYRLGIGVGIDRFEHREEVVGSGIGLEDPDRNSGPTVRVAKIVGHGGHCDAVPVQDASGLQALEAVQPHDDGMPVRLGRHSQDPALSLVQRSPTISPALRPVTFSPVRRWTTDREPIRAPRLHRCSSPAPTPAHDNAVSRERTRVALWATR